MEIIGHAAWGFMWGMVLVLFLLRWGRFTAGRSRAALYAMTGLIGFLMAVYALIPDYGALWGDYNTDHMWYDDAFLFAMSMDTLEVMLDNILIMRIFEFAFMMVGFGLLSYHINVIGGVKRYDRDQRDMTLALRRMQQMAIQMEMRKAATSTKRVYEGKGSR